MMKRAIIFGATGGIGQAIAEELATAGWSLYLQYQKQAAAAQKLAKQLAEKFPEQDFIPFQLDMAADVKLDVVFDDFLAVNGLVFAQGITDYALFAEQDNATIDQIFQVNLVQPLKIVKYFEPRLLNAEHSRIIFIGSVYGKNGSALEAIYSSSKGGLTSFASAYAKEVASAGLTVNVLAPGAVSTPMTADFSTEEIAALTTEIPVGRMAQPSDISFWVKNIIDERADYLTGQTIYVTGGWLV